MGQYNLVVIQGRLIKDPEFRYTKNNNGMLKFAIANNQMGIDNNGVKVEKANFFDVVCFGKTAEIFNKYLKKGSHIIVTGKLKQGRWEKEGQKRSKITIWADSINFVNSGKKSKIATHTA